MPGEAPCMCGLAATIVVVDDHRQLHTDAGIGTSESKAYVMQQNIIHGDLSARPLASDTLMPATIYAPQLECLSTDSVLKS